MDINEIIFKSQGLMEKPTDFVEIINNIFNFQQNIYGSNFRYTVIPISRKTQGPFLSLVCFINNEPYNWISVYFHAEVQAIFPLVFPRGYFLESIFLLCGLNSFQQLAISIPFSRFMSVYGIKVTPVLRHSIKSTSLTSFFSNAAQNPRKLCSPNQLCVFCS